MALIKTYNHKGRDAEYWRIIQYNSSFIDGSINIVLGLYFDKETRIKTPNAILETKQILVYYSDFSDVIEVKGTNKDLVLGLCYNAIKIASYLETLKATDDDLQLNNFNADLAWFVDAINDEIADEKEN